MIPHMIVVAGEALIDVVVDPDGDDQRDARRLAAERRRRPRPARRARHADHPGRPRRARRPGRRSTSTAAASRSSPPPPPTGARRSPPPTSTRRDSRRYDFDLEWSLPRQELPPCRRAARRLAGHRARAGPRERARPGRAGRAPATCSSATTPTCARPSSTTATALARRAGRSGARCTLVKLSDEDAELLAPDADPDDVARSLLRRRAHRAGAAHPRAGGRHGLRRGPSR